MPRLTLPFPILPGKTEADARVLTKLLLDRPEEYAESRRRLGITMERSYLQKTPMGDFVVVHIESARDFAVTSAQLAQSDLDIDKRFIAGVKETHGFDPTEVPQGPAPENVGEWVDPDVSTPRRGMAFTAPLLPGVVDKARAWAREAYVARKDELAANRRGLGINKEILTLLSTPQGEVAGIYLEGHDPFEANRKFAASTAPYDVWFKEQLTTIFPPFVDFSLPVPDVEEIFDSQKLLARA